jgi:energy-coupling factor transport system ATP-binding protein
MTSQELLTTASDLYYTYPDGTPALTGIDLQIRAGEFIAFIGQNGSGKTTLSKCLAALLKPSQGSVTIEGISTASRGITKKIATKVGYVFQNPDHQIFNDSVVKEIAYGPRNIGLSEKEVDERVREGAAVAGIGEDLFNIHPFFLTKGLRQRVAIASILALRPRVIIVDEPTTGQDYRQSIEVMDFLKKLWMERGHTIVIITHEMQIVARYAQRTVVLGLGTILLDGTTREVFAKPEILAKTYVKPPQITNLAHELSGYGMPMDILSVSEMLQAFKTRMGAESAKARTGIIPK